LILPRSSSKLARPIGHSSAAIDLESRPGSILMDIVWFIIIGIVAGWLAGKIMKGSGYGILGDLVLGIVGAIVGGFLFGLLDLHAGGLIGSLVTATVGAIVLIFLVRLLKRA
jgi:uncharacterized membrane protein YeaQ/YmgE (transglycosylase-associated protein family)